MLEWWDSGYYGRLLCGASQLVITGVINSSAVTSLFQRRGPLCGGPSGVLADPNWPIICCRRYPEAVLSIPTFQWWQHFSEISVPLRNSNKWWLEFVVFAALLLFLFCLHIYTSRGSRRLFDTWREKEPYLYVTLLGWCSWHRKGLW